MASPKNYEDYIKRFEKDRPGSARLKESKKYLYAALLEPFAEDLIPEELRINHTHSNKQAKFPDSPIRDKKFFHRVKENLNHFEDIFCKADALAMKYQNRYQSASRAIYFLSALAVISISFQHIFHLPHVLGVIELLAIIMILLIIFFGNKRGWHERWRDYRFLAERIRYGMFVSISGWEKSPKVKTNLIYKWVSGSWCIKKFKDLKAQIPAVEKLNEQDKDTLLLFINVSLLENQRNFQNNKRKREYEKHEKISSLAKNFFWLTFAAATLHIIPALAEFLELNIHLPFENIVASILTFLAIVFPTMAAAFTGLRSHFDHKNLSVRAEIMEDNLKKLQEKLNVSLTLEQVQNYTREAESLMIQESSDWYVTIGLHELERP